MKKKMLCIAFTLCVMQLFGQSKTQEKSVQNFPILVAFSSHSYSWPIVQSFVTPIQPGFKIGTEYVYSEREKYAYIQTVNLGFFRHPEWLNAYYLNSYFAVRRTFSFNMFVDAKIGAGYVHKQHTREVFMLNDNGDYESKPDFGTPAVQGGFGFGLGYNVKLGDKTISTFVEYDWSIIYPHVKEEIPIMAHSLYHIGVRYYLSK